MCGRDDVQQQLEEKQTTASGDNDDGLLEEYLDTFLTAESFAQQQTWQRVDCCGTSRSLYCPECCRILIPESDWPECIRDGTLDLPFDLDLVLHDRRKGSSGLQAIALLNAAAANAKTNTDVVDARQTETERHRVRLVDVDGGQELPDYSDSAGVYLLFPSPDSQPLHEVFIKLKKLVVLDCKWTKLGKKDHPHLAHLPKVHLTLKDTTNSHFWRWHNAGPGKVSTLEALYYAAKQVACTTNNNHNNVIHLMWLFALQRAFIQRQSIQNGCSVLPFDDDGKEEQRRLRRCTEQRRQELKAQARQRKQRTKQK